MIEYIKTNESTHTPITTSSTIEMPHNTNNYINNTKLSIFGYETQFTIAVVLVFMFGMFIGALKYMYETIILQGKKPRLSHLIIYSFISGFAGYIVYNLLRFYGLEPDHFLIGPITGVGSWSGVALIQTFEKSLSEGLLTRLKDNLFFILTNRTSVKKENTIDTDNITDK